MNKLRLMESFVTVVRRGSFTAAARQLGRSRSLLSKHITQIERHLKAKILNRDTHSVTLTDVGKQYFAFCEEILEEMARTESRLRHVSAVESGTIRVLAAPTFGRLFLAEAIADYMAEFPGITILSSLVGQPLRVGDITSKSYDLVVSTIRPKDSHLSVRWIAPIRNVVCATPAYLQRHGTPRRPAELTGHRCFYHRNTHEYKWRFFDGASAEATLVPLPPLPVTNNLDLIKHFTRRGLGIGLIPEFCVFEELRSGALVEVLRDFRTQENALHVLFPKATYTPPHVSAFVEFLSRRFSPAPWREG